MFSSVPSHSFRYSWLTRSGVETWRVAAHRRHRRAAPTRAIYPRSVPKPSAKSVFFRIPLLLLAVAYISFSPPRPFSSSFYSPIRLFLTPVCNFPSPSSSSCSFVISLSWLAGLRRLFIRRLVDKSVISIGWRKIRTFPKMFRVWKSYKLYIYERWIILRVQKKRIDNFFF